MNKGDSLPLPYVPMAPLPRPSSSAARMAEVPTSSTDSHRPHCSSIDSYASQASTIPFDMLQLPNGERGSGVSAIHEDVSAGRASPSVNSSSGSAAPPPTWFTNLRHHSVENIHRTVSQSYCLVSRVTYLDKTANTKKILIGTTETLQKERNDHAIEKRSWGRINGWTILWQK